MEDQIIHFVPYGLKLVGKDRTIEALNLQRLSRGIEGFKPLVRPLSALLTYIKTPLYKGLPAAELFKSSLTELAAFNLAGTIPQHWQTEVTIIEADPMAVPFSDFRFLLNLHFDVFGWLPKGLAIEI